MVVGASRAGTLDDEPTHDSPFPIRLLVREIQRDGEHVNVIERTRQSTTPIFEVGPIYITLPLVKRRAGQIQRVTP
jgi:hypothetical protein